MAVGISKGFFCRQFYPFFVVVLFCFHLEFWLFLVLTIWCAYFFRDPERYSPTNTALVLSPADGKISYIGCAPAPQELGFGETEMLRISVFMNVFSVHVNRMPMTGEVKTITYHVGAFGNAELDKASQYNERNSLVIETAHGDIGVVQIAGLVARRILCQVKEKEHKSAGERFGLIRFGSRLDVYLPVEAKVQVSVGQMAIAGETILAAFDDRPALEEFKIL